MNEGSMTKICLIIPSLQAGGMERVMVELANTFVRQARCEIHLLLYGINREIFYDLSPQVIVHKPSFAFNNKMRLVSTIRTFFYVRKCLKKIRPNTCLSFGEYWNSFILICTKGLNLKVYVSDRSQPNLSLGPFQDLLRKKLYPTAKGVIAQTQKARKTYEKLYGHQDIRVIANPVREILNDPVHFENRENIILTVGRLIHTKHHDRLIDIFLRIQKPNWKLVIVGYDHLNQQNSECLRAIIKKHRAEETVILAGKQQNVDHYYLKSKIFAFTSSSEGFPNVIGEALSAGLPVISYDCDAGPSDLIQHGKNGYLVNVFDDCKFTYYLEKLMDDEDKRGNMAKEAVSSVQNLRREKIASRYLSFITGDE